MFSKLFGEATDEVLSLNGLLSRQEDRHSSLSHGRHYPVVKLCLAENEL